MLFSGDKLPLCVAAAVFTLAGCAADPELLAETESVQTVTESESAGCIFLKDVYAREFSQEGAVDSLRLQAAETGADSVLVASLQAVTFPDYMFGYGLHNNGGFITTTTEFYARGRAYICDPEAKAAFLSYSVLKSSDAEGKNMKSDRAGSEPKDAEEKKIDPFNTPAAAGSLR